ncbi:hematopoietic SH2 domain-containing protein homolog [Heterodontus francisci]|uniref:hematopoietic SH2 domain-containing protein homolog n=1 Tax=Heterodontus francisci TaxID=7792 RepID=UPI00355B18AF
MDSANTTVTRKAAITWFTMTQASKIVRGGTIPDWFHGIISRREAEELLKDKSLGCFLIRVAESRIGFSLSYRGFNRCRHYFIDVTTGGQYNIAGELNFHKSLQDLVTFHTQVPILPFKECLTVPCGQVSHANAGYEELCIFLPTRKKPNSPTPHSHSSTGSSCPTMPHSASNNWSPNLSKQVASSALLPPKGDRSSESPPAPFPRRGMTDMKPVPAPKAMTDEPTLQSDRVPVKRLYPSLRSQPTAISMEQQSTPGVTVSGPQNLLLQRNQNNNPERRIQDTHSSSAPDLTDSKSEFKHQANDDVYSRHPNPIPIQRQQADHMTDTNRFASAPKYTDSQKDHSPSTRSHQGQMSPAPRHPLHPPRTPHGQSMSHGQSVLHRPPLCSMTTRFGQAEAVGGCQLLTDCAEGEVREQGSGRVDLPAEYMIPPPYAPGYQTS